MTGAGSIEDNVFGTFGDTINLRERYATCSKDYVDFKPYSGTTSTGVSISNGMYQLDLSIAVSGASNSVVRNTAQTQATTELGSLSSQFDYGRFNSYIVCLHLLRTSSLLASVFTVRLYHRTHHSSTSFTLFFIILVLMCLPRGTINNGSTGWLAYAYINHWLSVYNDNGTNGSLHWCSSPSALVHELGHNLNLGHSGEGSAAYGDQIGFVSSFCFCSS
jgi:hypothetical protein